jgi:hypothetical protein
MSKSRGNEPRGRRRKILKSRGAGTEKPNVSLGFPYEKDFHMK